MDVGLHPSEEAFYNNNALNVIENMFGVDINHDEILGSLEEEKKDSRFEEMKDWDAPRLSGFSAALENVPVPEESERSFCNQRT